MGWAVFGDKSAATAGAARSRRRLCRPTDAAYPLRVKRNAWEQKYANPVPHPVPAPTPKVVMRGRSLFHRRRLAQGRRGPRHPPHRFTRPPSHEQADPPQRVRLFVSALFLLDRPRPVLFLAHPKREWGAGFPGNLPASPEGHTGTESGDTAGEEGSRKGAGPSPAPSSFVCRLRLRHSRCTGPGTAGSAPPSGSR